MKFKCVLVLTWYQCVEVLDKSNISADQGKESVTGIITGPCNETFENEDKDGCDIIYVPN